MTSKQATKQDVVDLLIEQHRQIKTKFQEFGNAPTTGNERRERFEELVRLLAVHESAEELVVHPAARDVGEDINIVVQRRLVEEKDAKQMLAELYDLGVDSPQFGTKFASLAGAVVTHAEREEDEEFPALRRSVPEERRQRMARMLLAAQKLAPTRPHPHSGESPGSNLLAGPPLAVFDRVRDRLRDMMQD